MSLGNRLTLWLLGLPLLVLLFAATLDLHQESEWRKSALRDRLVTAAELQAPMFAQALVARDQSQLDSLARRLLDIDEARGVGVYTETGMTMLELGRSRAKVAMAPPQETQLDTQGDLWRLMVPLDLTENNGIIQGLAWLEIDIDSRALTLDHYRRLAIAGLVLLILELLLFVMASSLGRRLDSNLNGASEALRRLRGGDLHTRLAEDGPPELNRLAQQVNALGDELEHSRDNIQRQIEQTTADLQESMETIEIKNIELDLAHRRALEANRVKSEFLASMSHEIRTPLNGIVGFCRLLGRSRLDPRQREWLDQVQVACDNLLALVNDVLDFSRIEAGRLKLDRADVDMVSLVDEVLGLQAPLAHQKGLHLLGLVYDDVPSPLRGDPLRIRQVLINLVHNALKFTEEGEVIVRVMVEDHSHTDQVLLRISISDTGIGLTPKEQHDLFQAFHQATAGHSRQYGGSGLGLAISRQLVEQMGGRISVESAPTKGSTFAVSLPLEVIGGMDTLPERILDGQRIALYEPHAPTRHALSHLLCGWGAQVVEIPHPTVQSPPPALMVAGLPTLLSDTVLEEWQTWLNACPCPVLLLVNATPLELPKLTFSSGGELLCKPISRQALAEGLRRCSSLRSKVVVAPSLSRLLVVDDNASNRRLLKDILQRPGLWIEEAGSGEAALAIAENEPFDLVLMDIRMPGMDGVETTRALRKLGGSWSHCPVIAVTAHALEGDRQQLLASGLQEVLIKPVDSNALEAILQRHLRVTPPVRQMESDATERQEQSAELAVIDLLLGTRLANGSQSLALELLEELATSLPSSARELQAALSTEDPEALLDTVHALNGACRYCGAPELALVAETLETRLRSEGMTGVEPLIDDLFRAMERLRAWHAQQQNQPSSTTIANASSASSLRDK
ncbi:response regulator [Halomonas sp. DQ26W]|uniref:ATP-binding protein n=1 Tax=Halomonas sp. DQ26W TaxID=2282311 RepID=UPI000DF7E9A1|nr:ATP-binding protein [Halomonas sp. DQ26W]RDB43237.1 response regulator [Halomonas sp. DQ26W]